MRELRIVMPLAAHIDGHMQAHVELEIELCRLAGGCTAYRGTGSWVDNGQLVREEVIIYDVAIYTDNATSLAAKALLLAVAAGQALQQKAIYFRDAGNDVRIVELGANAAPAAPAAQAAPAVPLGTKRVPEPGEVWKMRDGRTVAVIRLVKDGVTSYPMQCRAIETGADVYLTDDGRAHHDRTESALDLMTFVSRWRD